MTPTRSTDQKGLKFLRLKKVVTLAELALHLRCSSRTAQRRLADWHALNSYNRNGGCYALPDIPRFDANGLWRHRGAFFSRFGNLPETFLALVANSPGGLSAGEAGELLGLRASSFLWSLREHPSLKREKHPGGYVYFSSSSSRYRSQSQQRKRMKRAGGFPTDFEAVAILVEKLKNPALSAEGLRRRLKKRKLRVESEAIENLFARHGLAVKKTSPSI